MKTFTLLLEHLSTRDAVARTQASLFAQALAATTPEASCAFFLALDTTHAPPDTWTPTLFRLPYPVAQEGWRLACEQRPALKFSENTRFAIALEGLLQEKASWKPKKERVQVPYHLALFQQQAFSLWEPWRPEFTQDPTCLQREIFLAPPGTHLSREADSTQYVTQQETSPILFSALLFEITQRVQNAEERGETTSTYFSHLYRLLEAAQKTFPETATRDTLLRVMHETTCALSTLYLKQGERERCDLWLYNGTFDINTFGGLVTGFLSQCFERARTAHGSSSLTLDTIFEETLQVLRLGFSWIVKGQQSENLQGAYKSFLTEMADYTHLLMQELELGPAYKIEGVPDALSLQEHQMRDVFHEALCSFNPSTLSNFITNYVGKALCGPEDKPSLTKKMRILYWHQTQHLVETWSRLSSGRTDLQETRAQIVLSACSWNESYSAHPWSFVYMSQVWQEELLATGTTLPLARVKTILLPSSLPKQRAQALLESPWIAWLERWEAFLATPEEKTWWRQVCTPLREGATRLCGAETQQKALILHETMEAYTLALTLACQHDGLESASMRRRL